MKKTTILIISVILAAGIAYALFMQPSVKAAQSTVEATPGGDVQHVTLSIQNGNYYPQTVTVKSGKPVSISLDRSVQGCYRTFTIRSLGINRNLPTPQDTIDFTAPAPGQYPFACGMGMGRGILVVE